MRHLVIAGTGRAGTTHLVQWLAARGLDCGTGVIDPISGGGLEHRLTGTDLPYVVKDPWLFTYLDDIDPSIIDVLVVPVRDLHDAAASRVRIELAHLDQTHPGWRSNIWGSTPGGMIHRLHVEAQAPILAAGFHQLVQWAVAHDVRLVLLDFGRIADDTYLDKMLGEWLPC